MTCSVVNRYFLHSPGSRVSARAVKRFAARLSTYRFETGHESSESAVPKLGIPCAGTKVYAPRYREEWLKKITEAGVRRRAQLYYQHLDGLQVLRRKGAQRFMWRSPWDARKDGSITQTRAT
jgi:hypothetical protein